MTTTIEKKHLLYVSDTKPTDTIFIEAYNDFEKSLRAHAFFKVHDAALCDDLVQETFLKTWKYLMKEKKIELMKPFLYHILNCLIIDEYRKYKSTSLDSLLEKGYEPATEDFTRIFDRYDAEQASALIDRLPITYRKVMYMRYIQELSVPEISSITGQSKNTIAVQTHRGLEKLRSLYVLQ